MVVSELQGAVEEVYDDLQQEGLTRIFITAEELRSSHMKSLIRAAQESSDADVPQTLVYEDTAYVPVIQKA